MKKWLVFSLAGFVAAVLWGGQAFTQADNPKSALKPTFLAPTPGLYVHGWPAFTVSYPKDWTVQTTMPWENFRAAAARKDLPPSPALVVRVFTWFAPLSSMNWVFRTFVSTLGVGKDFKALYDRPTQLTDSTPAQEAEIEWTFMSGPRLNSFLLAAKKDATFIIVSIDHDQGKIGEDLKKIAYSLRLMPDQEKPVQVPDDVRAFLDQYSSHLVSRDLGKIMADYSDNFRHTGLSKEQVGTSIQTTPDSPIIRGGGLTSSSATVTIFEPHGDKAYIDGFFTEKHKEDPLPVTKAMWYMQIIKENGQWKWYGNQK
jgi:hypothetical protein